MWVLGNCNSISCSSAYYKGQNQKQTNLLGCINLVGNYWISRCSPIRSNSSFQFTFYFYLVYNICKSILCCTKQIRWDGREKTIFKVFFLLFLSRPFIHLGYHKGDYYHGLTYLFIIRRLAYPEAARQMGLPWLRQWYATISILRQMVLKLKLA